MESATPSGCPMVIYQEVVSVTPLYIICYLLFIYCLQEAAAAEGRKMTQPSA